MRYDESRRTGGMKQCATAVSAVAAAVPPHGGHSRGTTQERLFACVLRARLSQTDGPRPIDKRSDRSRSGQAGCMKTFERVLSHSRRNRAELAET